MRFLVDRWKYGFEAWEESEMARWLLIVSRVEEAVAPHSSALAWKIPWTEEPSGLAAHGVAKSRTSNTTERLHFHFHALEKEMAPTPVLLPGESQGRGSLVGCRLWRRTESDTTERLSSSNSVACTVHKAPRVLGTEHIGSVR